MPSDSAAGGADSSAFLPVLYRVREKADQTIKELYDTTGNATFLLMVEQISLEDRTTLMEYLQTLHFVPSPKSVACDRTTRLCHSAGPVMPQYTPLAQRSWLQPALECPFQPSRPAHRSALCEVFSRAPFALRQSVVQQHNPSLLIGLCHNDMDAISVIVAMSELVPQLLTVSQSQTDTQRDEIQHIDARSSPAKEGDALQDPETGITLTARRLPNGRLKQAGYVCRFAIDKTAKAQASPRLPATSPILRAGDIYVNLHGPEGARLWWLFYCTPSGQARWDDITNELGVHPTQPLYVVQRSPIPTWKKRKSGAEDEGNE